MNKSNYKTLLLSSLVLALSILPATAQEDSKQQEHKIFAMGFLNHEFEKIKWIENDERVIKSSQLQAKSSIGLKGEKKGQILSPGQPYREGYPSSVDTTLDINAPANAKAVRHLVKGMYQVTLPKVIRIQLEVDYFVVLDDNEKSSTTEFYIDVYERIGTSDEWVKSGEVHERQDKLDFENKRPLEFADAATKERENIISHSYNALLSDWAGKEVLLGLVAYSPDKTKLIKGRWTNARLVCSTFDFRKVVE
jgi:hypothetical protein